MVLTDGDEQVVEISTVLRVFQKLQSQGESCEEGRTLHGLTAVDSPDDYAVTLKDSAVTMVVFFHNRYEINVDSRFGRKRALRDFVMRIQKVDEDI